MAFGGQSPEPETEAGRFAAQDAPHLGEPRMNGLIYLVGLVVIILAILSFFGLR